MHDIICPHCKKAFKVDESGYAEILRQVRDEAFEKQLDERLAIAEQEKKNAIALAQAGWRNELNEAMTTKDSELQELRDQLVAEEARRREAIAQTINTALEERQELMRQLEQMRSDGALAAQQAQSRLAAELQNAKAEREMEVLALSNQLDAARVAQDVAVANAEARLAAKFQKVEVEKAMELQALQASLDAAVLERNLAVTEAVSAANAARDALARQLDQARNDSALAAQQAQATLATELQTAKAEREKEVLALRNQLDAARIAQEVAVANEKTKLQAELQNVEAQKAREVQALQASIDAAILAQKVAVNEAVIAGQTERREVERQRDELKVDLERAKIAKELSEKSLKDTYENIIKVREDTIEKLKELKASLNSKMSGETLEQHCETEFREMQQKGAFSSASFAKDNDASSGSKGDYIFREKEGENEVVSIMFEMKNEIDASQTKKKNLDFFKELDKDRKAKNCEYAVLVSLLEADNDLYNNGIVDVSLIDKKYEKMYVVRPQFFIPIISLLRNAALKSNEHKRELEIVRQQNYDITNFEKALNEFKESYSGSHDRASRKFQTVIDEIDKSINHLTETKNALNICMKHFNSANNKAQDITIRSLTRGNPTMTRMFKEAGGQTASGT